MGLTIADVDLWLRSTGPIVDLTAGCCFFVYVYRQDCAGQQTRSGQHIQRISAW